MRYLAQTVDGLNRSMSLLCHIILIVIVCVIAGQVFLRFIVNQPTSWSEELALLLLIWYGMISVGVAVGRHGHIAIMTLRNLLPKFGRQFVDVLAQTMILLFAAVVFWNALDLIAIVGGQRMPAMGVSKTWLYYPTLVGTLLMAINALSNLLLGRISPPEMEVHS